MRTKLYKRFLLASTILCAISCVIFFIIKNDFLILGFIILSTICINLSFLVSIKITEFALKSKQVSYTFLSRIVSLVLHIAPVILWVLTLKEDYIYLIAIASIYVCKPIIMMIASMNKTSPVEYKSIPTVKLQAITSFEFFYKGTLHKTFKVFKLRKK